MEFPKKFGQPNPKKLALDMDEFKLDNIGYIIRKSTQRKGS